MKKVAIIDYGAGNTASLVNAIKYINFEPIILKKPVNFFILTKKNYSDWQMRYKTTYITMVEKIKTKKSIRELFLWYCVNFGLFIVFTTEFLSFFGLINNFSIFTCWVILLLLGYIIFISKFRYYFCSLITKINFSLNVITLFRFFISKIGQNRTCRVQ